MKAIRVVQVIGLPLLILLVLLIVLYFGSCGTLFEIHGMDRARNWAARGKLRDIMKALEIYKTWNGSYPNAVHGVLVADTREVYRCLSRLNVFVDTEDAERDRLQGEFLSPHDRPYSYSFPANVVPAPDGRIHPQCEYYLWTWGWNPAAPDASWEINNWEQ